MRVWYEVWGMDDDEAAWSLWYKFPVPDPSDPQSEEETRCFARRAADDLTNNDVRRAEVRRVVEKETIMKLTEHQKASLTAAGINWQQLEQVLLKIAAEAPAIAAFIESLLQLAHPPAPTPAP